MLAGGVAHDLNNILSGIMSYPELILMDLDEHDKLRKPLLTIMDSGKPAAAVVQDLLTIARGVASTKKIANLNYIWEDYCQSPEYQELRSSFPNVDVKTILASEVQTIRCSAVHIKKAMMNLLTNAMESIADAGTVVVSTENRYLTRPLKGYDDFVPGDYSMLRVEVNGPGIRPDDLERIFEPFYTKKEMGRSGTGLGLTVVWNTVLDHDGYVNVASDPNKTVFERYFPVRAGVEEGINEKIPLERLKGDGQSVLVVDDEISQREIAHGMLEMLGYSPASVSSEEEAISYLGSHSVDVLLRDMLMPPGITGLETYQRIIQLHPGQKAIVASGFSESDDVRRTQHLGAGEYLKKPYTIQALGLAVRRELERS
jgi:CheY-like chemotaxis protein